MNWYLEVLKKYAVFEGRARRSEIWYFYLFNVVITMILWTLDGMMGTHLGPNIGILSDLYSLAVLIPTIAVGVRRFHDIGKSGWWIMIGFIPVLGALALIYFFVQDSQAGDNLYGPNPKGTPAGGPAA